MAQTNKSPGARIVRVRDVTNAAFLQTYAAAGRIGLSGGRALVDLAISRAQRHLDAEHQWSLWSHAFVFEGVRADNQHWLVESDLVFQHKHIQLGVQENRISRYDDDSYYTRLAVIDLGLDSAQVKRILAAALELVATRAGYSIRELVGTLIAMRRPSLRGQENVLARDRAIFCSAFVQHCFRAAGLDLTPGVDIKNTAPEDLARSPLAKTIYLLERDQPASAVEKLGGKLRAAREKVRASILKRTNRSD